MSQSPADWWYFGQNAGVHFTSSGPVADTNGAINTSEGCAATSDLQGNLMFYTDGSWVYNANHEVMPNGSGLLGNSSSTQSAVIIPAPGSSERYYLFTVGLCGTANEKFAYSIVDMTLDGGLGDIDTAYKNIVLYDSTSEKCTAAPHANGHDIWVVGREFWEGTYHAYLITSNGIEDSVTTYTNEPNNCAGYMLANHQGNQIVVAQVVATSPTLIYDFDQSTGVLSSPDTLFGQYYGAHFSPNDQFLYLGYNSIRQYDLNVSNIQASEYLVTPASGGALAEGPDGKIYSAKYGSYLTVIHDPDQPGALCNFQDSAVFLENRVCILGLPNFVSPGIFYLSSFETSGECFGDSVRFSFDTSNVDAAQWNFGDPGSGGFNTSSSLFPSHVFSDTGEFTIRLIVQSDTVFDTTFQTIRIYPRQTIDLGSDTVICNGEQILYSVSQPYATYLWNDSSSADTFLTNGENMVRVSVFGRCDTVHDSVMIAYDDSIQFDLGPDTLLCGGDSLELNTFITDSSVIQWSTGDSVSAITVSLSGVYEVNAINACGSFKDTINVDFKPFPSSDLLPPDTINCFDNEIVLSHDDLDSVTYIWSDSSSKKNYRVDTTEVVWLAAFNECGSTIDTIDIIFNGEIISELGEDTTICDLDTLILDAFSPGASYVWNTGDSIDSIFTGTTSELYVVTVTRGPCKTIESKRVDLSSVLCEGIDCSLETNNVFTPNGDGINDIWRASSDCEITSYGLNIYNRWGQLIHHSSNATFGWDGYINGLPAAQGVYYYELVFKDRVVVAVDSKEFKGSISLIR